MRLIDGDELLEKMYRYTDNEGAKMPYGDNDSLIHKDSACFLIENAPTIEPQPHWIPCSERLPEEDDVEVLCTVKQQNKTNRSETIIVEQGCYFYGTWLLSYDNQRVNCSREVLAWQPLPSPYQREGEQNEINRC